MSFNNAELNKNRENWKRPRQVSEQTDPDYADRIAYKVLIEISKLSAEEQKLALESFSHKKRKEMLAQLEQLKTKSNDS